MAARTPHPRRVPLIPGAARKAPRPSEWGEGRNLSRSVSPLFRLRRERGQGGEGKRWAEGASKAFSTIKFAKFAKFANFDPAQQNPSLETRQAP